MAFLGAAPASERLVELRPGLRTRCRVDRFGQLRARRARRRRRLPLRRTGARPAGGRRSSWWRRSRRCGPPFARAPAVPRRGPDGPLAVARGGRDRRTSRLLSRLPFDHPLWVLFSSGTTGRPRASCTATAESCWSTSSPSACTSTSGPATGFSWYTTPSWMVWNYRASGAAARRDRPLLRRQRRRSLAATCCGRSPPGTGVDRPRAPAPGIVAAAEAAGVAPAEHHDLAVAADGRVVPARTCRPRRTRWVGDAGRRARRSSPSISGGTDVATGFAGGAPILPVRAGELSGRASASPSRPGTPPAGRSAGRSGSW